MPEHLASLPGIGEPLPRGDPPRSQTGRLPRPLGRTSAHTAQWFDLCLTTKPFFIETVEKVKRIPAAERTREMHAIYRRWRESVKVQKPPCFKIRDGTPADMVEVLSLWEHNPEGVPTAIRQEDDGSLNTSDIDIWMWLKTLTPIKGVMVRQRIMQLFGEAGQWALLAKDADMGADMDHDLRTAIQRSYDPGEQHPLEIPMEDLVNWLGKYAGVTYLHAVRLGGYAKRTLAKTAHSDASRLGKRRHETAQSKDRLSKKKTKLENAKQLDNELSAISPVVSSKTTTRVAPPSSNIEEGSTETRAAPAPYIDPDVPMADADDSLFDDIYD